VRPGDLVKRIGVQQGSRKKAKLPVDPGITPSELAQRREDLARRFAELQWDLGGIVYEMAIRDHFRVDLVSAQAAKLQAVDAELAEAERLLKLEDAGAAGTCPACGALHARGAAFCSQCGNTLIQQPAAHTNGTTPEVHPA
jgi:hypothetical protein